MTKLANIDDLTSVVGSCLLFIYIAFKQHFCTDTNTDESCSVMPKSVDIFSLLIILGKILQPSYDDICSQ